MVTGGEQMVCVTGAGGFIGSWLVKELLHRGYAVRAAVRDPEGRKNAHLHALERAKRRLSLHRADVLDCNSLRAAFNLCDGVFHVASPVSDDPELLPTAIEGTKNVINAAADMGIKRVVFTSSYGAAHMNPNRRSDQTLDETCWSDLEFCKQTQNWYCYAKTVAEKTATEEASKRGVQLLVVVPAVTVGEMLQPTLNASVYRVATYMRGTKSAYPNAVAAYVDVRDVARAHALVYEHPDARGRYLCIGSVLHRSEFVRLLRELFPQYPITTRHAVHSFERELVQDSDKLTGQGSPTSNLTSFSPNRSTTMVTGRSEQMVCVTGAGGFIGSWLVKELLHRGYFVRGAMREPADIKNAHLHVLDGAREGLSLYRADVLDRNSLRAAFALCDGVFHVASPVSNDPELLPAAIEGTKNVINAAADMGVKRVVFTSSYGAVHMNPNRRSDQIIDESCWSDLEFCKQTQMLAERTAMEEASKRGVNLLVVVPAVTVGEMLQPTLNASVHRVATYMMGTKSAYPNAVAAYVDVRGRYLCIGSVLHRSEFVRLLRELFPQYPITSRCKDNSKPMVKPYKFSVQRLETLGMQFTPLKESLYRTVISLQDKGHLPAAISRRSAL
uniref:NAD-dependent epimerase/dehydratase domain-containing protein n=1 Tax=Oryza rufipogon TaxID=4529 RepID=A0A0E0MUT2_ORYRU